MSKQKRVDTKLLADVAQMSLVKELSQKEIGDRLRPKRDQAAVSRLLQEAWDNDIVHYDIDPEYGIAGTEQDRRGDEVRDEFGLKDCLVVDTDPTFTNDELHIALANHTGRRVRHTIETGDHIALAGGRTIVRLARVIARNPPSVRDIVVTPLGGWLWSGKLWLVSQEGTNYLERPLNPDYSALVLANGLHAGRQPGIRFSQISHPLYARDSDAAQEIMKSNCAFLPGGTWNWGLSAPTKAYVGVGVADRQSNHRMIQVLQQPGYESLVEAMKSVEVHSLPFFGDIANRLFCSLPLPGEDAVGPKDTEGYQQVIRKIHAVNCRAVVMEWEHLRSIASVRATAGGVFKHRVLWTLLLEGLINPKRRLINSLTTDLQTAEALLEAKRNFDASPDTVQDWYRSMLDEVFAA